MKTLNHGVFDNCDGLTEVVLQSGLTEIKTQSLGELKSVSQITIPKSVTTIEDHALGYKFTGVPGSEWQKNNDLIILGYEGSAAEKYAKDNGFNFVAITAQDPIDSVGITVTPPKPGQSPDTKAECDTDLAEFWGFSFDDNNNPVPTKGCICWFDGSRLMTPKDKFEGGKAYSAYITQLTPKEGYYFPFEAKITINGKRMNRDDDSEALSAQFICPKNIDSINMTVTEPKAGEKPSFEFKNSTEGVDISAEVEWYDDDTKLNKLNTFEAGNTYTVRIVVKREDFKVDEAYTIDGSTKYLINGQEAEIEIISGGVAFTAEFTAKKADDGSSTPDSSSKPDDSSSKPDKIYGLGDVNGDGTIDIEDAVMIINHVNGQKALTDDEVKRADIDANSDIDIEDAVAVISHVNGVKSLYR